MEYVKGLPITDYCDRHKLNIDERLRLFQRVCLGVHHAHQKGIIHRDLKPSNILVSTEGDEAIPKIIDFGVAKAISQPLTQQTLFTEESHLLGTPEYMSPEQAEMTNQDIDTRSDIYSLGVLLYELLAGILPYDSTTFRQGGVEHIRKTIREADPKTPSTRLTKLGEEAKRLAESRRTEVGALAKCLHRELEWIPLKAMRKDRSERYRSASEMADDIENYLKGGPLIAGPPGTWYRLKKSVRRHGALVGGTVAVVLASLIGVVVSVFFALGQARARTEAQLVSNFLKLDVLRSARLVKGREATVVDILNAALARLDEGRFRDRPLIEASIRHTLAFTYYDLGYYAVAAQHENTAHRFYAELLGENSTEANVALNWLAVFYFHAGKYREAEPLYQRVIEKAREQKAGFLVEKQSVWNANLATTYAGLGRYAEAEQLLRESLEHMRQDPDRLGVLGYGLHLGEVYRERGKYVEAEHALLEALDAGRQPQTARARANAQHASGMVRCMNELALLRLAQGRDQEAEALFEQGMDFGARELPGRDHPHMLRNVNGLAIIRIKQQRYEEAKTLLERALIGNKLKLGDDHPDTIKTWAYLGILHREQGQHEEAEKFLTEALDARRVKLGADHPHTLESVHELAVLYMRQSRYEDAERLLLEAFRGRQTKLGPEHPHTLDSLKQLVTLYESWAKPDEAAKWRAKVPPESDAGE
jgi:tetratricopeptide (TPR) repeat protein